MQAAISLQNLIQRAVIGTQQLQQQFHITKRLLQLCYLSLCDAAPLLRGAQLTMLAMSAMLTGSLAAASLAPGKAGCACSGICSRAGCAGVGACNGAGCAIATAGTVGPAVTGKYTADDAVVGGTGGAAGAGGCANGALGAAWHAVRFDCFLRLGCLHGRRSTWTIAAEHSIAYSVIHKMGLKRYGSWELCEAQMTKP